MTHTFIIRYRNGDLSLEQMRVNKYGEPTPKAQEGLALRGYASWCNINAWGACAGDEDLISLARMVGLG